MNKITKLLFLLILFLNCTGYAQQDDNYLKEANLIKTIAKRVALKSKINITLNDKGILEVKSQDIKAFNKLLDNKTTPKKIAQSDSKKKKTKKQNGPPETGGGEQPAADDDNGTKDNSKNSNSKISTAEKDELTKSTEENELKYILFIANTDDPNELLKIASTCPKRFENLEKLSKFGDLQTEGVKTNFAFSEAEIIYGIVDFTISRAKEQMVEVYLSKWYNTLKEDPIIKQLLPQTLGVLNAFNTTQSLNLAQYGDKWKAAFQEDLRNFPLQLQNEEFVALLLNKTNLTECSEVKASEIKATITGGSRLVYDLYLKKHLVNILSDMSAEYLLKPKPKNEVFKKLAVLSDILLKAGGTMDNNDVYISTTTEDINRMDFASWKIFAKLIYIRHLDAINYISDGESNDFLTQLLIDSNLNKFSGLYRQTINMTSTYQNAVNNSGNVKTNELNFEESRKLFELSFQLTDQVVNYIPIVIKDAAVAKKITDTHAKIKQYYSALSEIGEGIANRRYGAVVDGTAGIIRMMGTNEKMETTLSNFQIYGSFMVNIINAKDSEQVKSALDELIPRNLYKLKNTHKYNISLSAFPGVLGGAERIYKFKENADGTPQTDQPKESSWAFTPAVYLPIGIDLSLGSKCKEKNFISTNLFIQILDLGAALNYRITSNDSDEEPAPNVTFKQMLSPGLAIMRHLPNSPVVYGVSMNYTPSLRTINQSGNEYQSNAFRVGLFIAIDVTFLNLYTSNQVP
ncbi:hypothetical protein [uncultured Flavobacterium sp.]|uniref:hypothetical protein n=1 Tax=uncultured Flavobacterium sp. TaxID=165435 RepID=UPI003081BD75